MKNKIKLFITGVVFNTSNVFSQPPTGAAGTVYPPSVGNSSFAWFRGGNLPGGNAGTNNIFGTAAGFNSPIYTITNGSYRSKINGNVAYNINGFVAPRNGYLWLGPDAPASGGGTYYNNKGAFSLLHLNGTTALASIELGYRPWMKTGITFTENSDLMYVGRKSSGTSPATTDQTDAVIAWADDNSGPPFAGLDNLRFMFTNGNASLRSKSGLNLSFRPE